MLTHIKKIKALKAISPFLNIKRSLIKIIFSSCNDPTNYNKLKIFKNSPTNISLVIGNSRFSNNSNNSKWCNYCYKSRIKTIISRSSNRVLKITPPQQVRLIINRINNIALVFQEIEFIESIIIRHQYYHLQFCITYKTKFLIQRLSNYYFKDSSWKEHRVLIVNLLIPYIQFSKTLFLNLLSSHLGPSNLIRSSSRLTTRILLQTRLGLTPQYQEIILTKDRFRKITKAWCDKIKWSNNSTY